MDRTKANVVCGALLTTIASTGGVGIAGHLYAVLCDKVRLDEFETCVDILVLGGTLTRGDNHTLHITEKGKEIAAKCEAHYAAARA